MKPFDGCRMRLVSVGFAAVVVLGEGSAYANFAFGTPTNLGPIVNSSHGDADTSLSSDGVELFFDSDRPGGSGNWDLWVARRAAKADDWTQPVNLGPTVNSSTWYHDPSISADKLCLLFASNRPGGYGGDDLWVTRRGTANDAWGTPVNLGSEVNSANHEMDPALSMDGLQLHFCSQNRPGGYGSHDIWVARRASISDDWQEPVNLGPPVNTSYSDQAPSLSADGLVLVFRSDRPGGYGSGDLWMTRRQTIHDDWTEPVNLGPTVNSLHEDNDPDLFSDGSGLLFTSNRPGGCGGWDIWQVSINPIVDFSGDETVDLADFSKLAQYWCQDESSVDIGPTPLGDGMVDYKDLAVLGQYWLTEVLPVSLIAYWKLDETEGGIAHDSIGGNDAFGPPDLLWRPEGGKIGGALEFDGIDDLLFTTFSLNPADTSFSIFAWVKGGAPGQVIIGQASGANWLMADASDGKLITELQGTGRFDGPLYSQTVITDGHWHRVALTWDGSNRILYVDDVEVARDTQAGLAGSTGGLYFGAGKIPVPPSLWLGLLDDIHIYDRAIVP